MVKRYYYHLTQKCWAKKVTLEPRIKGCHRGWKEPRCKRTCVSPSIDKCLIALGHCLQNKYVYIYRTEKKVLARPAINVNDSKITNEKWLTRRIKFVRVGEIERNHPDLRAILNMSVGGVCHLKNQKRQLQKLMKLKKSYVIWI